MKAAIFTILFLLTAIVTSAQKLEYAISLIPANLKEHANAVVRLNQVNVSITARNAMQIHTYRVVSILNEYGLRNIDAAESYKVKSIEAVVYDEFGNEIKKLKRKDFKEVSASQGSMITDDKITYLDYTPVQYPFTIVYESETEDENTAFLAPWFPVDEPLVSVQKSVVSFNCVSGLGFKYKEYNFEGRNIKKLEYPNAINFTAENMSAVRNEEYSPSLKKMVPYVLFGLEKFHLEGVDGDATSWEAFSTWNYNNLLAGTDEITPETQAKIKALVGNVTDPLEKAKIVYKYVQDKTRYVSIQLGIGGWKPMNAKDVDRLGYGDCKALTNYTRALLKVVDVPAYYCIVYGARDKRDLQQDFVSLQGNHVILAIPTGDKLNWLECTSQTMPFGYEGRFTDDRMALIVKPDGGQLVRTNVYSGKDSKQITKGNYSLDGNGAVSGNMEIRSTGIQYDGRLFLERESNDDMTKFYKDYFGNINNLKLKNMHVSNDRDKIEFVENISMDAASYANTDNNRLIFAVNAFNQASDVPQRYRIRNNPLEISRGFSDYDEITINLPVGYSIEAKPEPVQLNDKFGEYKTEFIVVNAQQLLYKRSFVVNEGNYANTEYENYRKFREQVAKADNSKMVLVKN